MSGGAIGAGLGAATSAATGGDAVNGAVLGGAAGAATGVLTSRKRINLGRPLWRRGGPGPFRGPLTRGTLVHLP